MKNSHICKASFEVKDNRGGPANLEMMQAQRDRHIIAAGEAGKLVCMDYRTGRTAAATVYYPSSREVVEELHTDIVYFRKPIVTERLLPVLKAMLKQNPYVEVVPHEANNVVNLDAYRPQNLVQPQRVDAVEVN